MPKNKKIKALLDTNLIISAALIPQSPPEGVFRSWLAGYFDLLTSEEQLEEIRTTSQKGKLRSYPAFSDNIKEFIQHLEFAAEIIKPVSETDLPVRSRDPKDDYLLAASLGGKADYLITGDEDLLVLSSNPELGKLKIVTVRQFLSEIMP